MTVKGWERSGRKRTGRLSRKVDTRSRRPRILIVCEGKKTEPNYFNGFRLTSVQLIVEPVGAVHYSVVQRAIAILKEDSDYEEAWCVFDRDKHPANPNDISLFNTAVRLAKNKNINIAYSNDAFELWYLLHFGYYDTQLLRGDYIAKLNMLIAGGYQKNDPAIYGKLKDKMDDAIRNARKLYDKCDKNDPANADPSTTVFSLVERLKRLN